MSYTPGSLYNKFQAKKKKTLRTPAAVVKSEQNASNKYKKHKMIEGSKEDKTFDKKRNIKEGSKRDMPMKSKGMKCKTCGKSHSKGVKHKFDMMGGIKSFFSPKPATAQRVNTSIGNKIPGAGGYMQHANDLKTALNWKKKGMKHKMKGKKYKTAHQNTQAESVAARDLYLRTTKDSPAQRENYLHNHPNPSKAPEGWLPDHPLDWKPSSGGSSSSSKGVDITFPSTPSYKKKGKKNKKHGKR